MLVHSGVRELCKRLIVVVGHDHISYQANENATFLMKALIRSTLCTKRVADEHCLTAEAFEWVLGEIEAKFQQAMVSLPFIFHSNLNARSFYKCVPSRVNQTLGDTIQITCLVFRIFSKIGILIKKTLGKLHRHFEIEI